jgi:hypothetical protein
MNRFTKTATVIRCWRKNRYSNVVDHVLGSIKLAENTYLLFRCRRGSSRVVTRVIRTKRSMRNHYIVYCYHNRKYSPSKLMYLQNHYHSLILELEKKISWELLKA